MTRGRVCLRPPSVRAGLTALATIIAILLPVAVWAAPAPVATIEIEGVINPVTLRLVGLAIDRAQAERAQALVILLDTPGGLERSMRAIVQRMMNAEVPVVVFVAPTGARAASAGVFITMAGHVAAMAPATNIGAASPVSVGGGGTDKTMMKKVENDAAAFIRTVAIERGRNADWGEKAVRQAVAVTEREALKLNVIDLVADSLPDLLGKIDGRTIQAAEGPRDPRHQGRARPPDRDRLPRPVPERDHRPQRGLRPDDARHAGPLLRAVEPRRDPAGHHRRDLADPGVLRLPEPADQLRWSPADPLRHRAAGGGDQDR
ncbi:MAG: hypothetical protein DME05_04860, partial [Candidatus Rokuibacteriota bacterium]